MKILKVSDIREGDAFTIKNEPISSIDLMERAANNCSIWIMDNYKSDSSFSIFAGPGNNGGDGLVIARILHKNKYNVKIYIVEYTKNYSDDFKINLERLKALNIDIQILNKDKNDFQLEKTEIIIDSIFGSGLSRSVTGFTARIINQLNEQNSIISIDIASGLKADEIDSSKNPVIIRPTHTLSIAFPKLTFFLAENERYVGNWHNIDIGIHPQYIYDVKEFAHYILKESVKPMLRNRSKYSHKGSFGHALIIAGSYGKMGASILASRAALKTGLGLLTTHIPKSGVNILQTAIPEAMLSIDENDKQYSKNNELAIYNAIGVGPGLGTSKESQLALKVLIQNTSLPMVIDADALNILSENKTWLAFLPANSILTPHPKEFERLVGKSSDSLERIKKQREFSTKYNVIVVLKGANTSISHPDGRLFINSTGNPGMATAGSGDVLTGIITSLLAQSYNPLTAAILGAYLHGLAGDFAALKLGFESLIANDIIDNISDAFINLSST